MPITLHHVPLSADDRAHLARILEEWPAQPVLLVGETWIEGSQPFGTIEWGPPYLRMIHRTLTEVLQMAGILPPSDTKQGPPSPGPYDHLSKIDRAFLGQVASRLIPTCMMITPNGVIYQNVHPAMATPMVGLLGRSLDGLLRMSSEAQRVRPPKRTRV